MFLPIESHYQQKTEIVDGEPTDDSDRSQGVSFGSWSPTLIFQGHCFCAILYAFLPAR